VDTGRHLSRHWARLLVASWALAAVAVGITGSASLRTGKPLWWLDGSVIANVTLSVVLYLLMVGVILLALRGHPRAPLAGIGVASLLGASAAFDLVDQGGPGGSALVMITVAGAALLASVAAVAGLSQQG
jgi:hypothetical protein